MVEILGFDGKVHYRRPASALEVEQALRTPGYAVRGSIEDLPTVLKSVNESDRQFSFPLKIENGRFLAGPANVSHEEEQEFYRNLVAENSGPLVV
jgi:hypothetical protein